ncbi:30S ribosomal protein S4 [Candidatus Methanoperedenaceae archaeon GB50]|nr:30S ribosomal protein S4 [Candidatus Methanoperedenaceae archaeon GB50]
MRIPERQARQLVRHGHILINNKKVNIPSYLVEVGDVIKLREKSQEIPFVKEALEGIASRGIPSWLEVDKEKFEGRIKALPTREEIAIPVQEQLIVEFYSK